jgi:FkbM family methyltransferase
MSTAFCLVNCAHGSMIVNRLDYNVTYNNKLYGVGAQIFENGAYDPAELDILKALLQERRTHFGDGVTMLDCGANIGVFAVEIADFMRDWGKLIAIEAQERLFYALAGNIALHNCFNARAIWAAVDAHEGFIDIPEPDYRAPASFGSFELQQRLGNEDIGQEIDYGKPTSRVRTLRIDDAGLVRLDLIKLDIEGMELQALAGATATLAQYRPVVFLEIVKIDRSAVERLFEPLGYRLFSHGVMNVLAVHASDPTINSIQVEQKAA